MFLSFFYATPAMLAPGHRKNLAGERKLHYNPIDTETQGDNFILIFWVNTRIINLDYEGELDAVFCYCCYCCFTAIHWRWSQVEKGAWCCHMVRRRRKRKLKLPITSHLCVVWYQENDEEYFTSHHRSKWFKDDANLYSMKPFGKFIIIKEEEVKWLKDGTKRCY